MNTKPKNYYSASYNAFFLGALIDSYRDANYWPDDAIVVDDAVFVEFACKIPPKGKRRIAGDGGLPAWGDIPSLSPEQLQLQAASHKQQLLNTATEKINIYQDAVGLGIVTNVEESLLAEWRKYRVLLNRVDCSKAPDIDWPEQPK
ncbi:tail fiber assembly protein [Xenorhabdus indica]|uniref:tail fiber assembly protein n=1 Tax=Xenorhabdus indica TaxID=333964 RepID=UPI001656A024|nr:tail fiber assembly protein [Xenorhabdus indica]MBC8947117.1 phage tail fiber assembly [Xenorhabdus indica]